MKCISKLSVLRTLALLTAVLAVFSVQPAFAADFTIPSFNWYFTSMPLTGGETGTVAAGGGIIVDAENAVTITNDNNTLTNDGGIYTSSGIGVWINSTGTGNTVTNTGTIAADWQGTGAVIDGGTVTNSGAILTAGWAGDGVVINGGTLTNSGLISSDGGDGSGDALVLNGGTVTNSGIIQAIDNVWGLGWTGIGVNMTGGTLTNTGTISSEWTAALAVTNGTVTNSGAITSWTDAVQLNSGTVTNSGFIYSTDGGRGVLMSGGTLINDIDGTIQSDYGDALLVDAGTVTNSGFITSNGGDGIGNALELNGGTVTNSGTIQAIDTVWGMGWTGTGVNMSGGTLINDGTIYSEGMAALDVWGGTVTNSGTIESGNNFAVQMSNSTLTNTGIIQGLTGQGVFMSNDTTLTNEGEINGFINVMLEGATATITNGESGVITIDGAFIGIDAWGTTVTNSGTINISNAQYGVGVGGVNGSLTNSGTINMTNAFIGVTTSGVTLTNSGTISNSGMVALDFNGGTLTNSGTISGGDYGMGAFGGATVTNSGTIESTNIWYGTGMIVEGSAIVNTSTGLIQGGGSEGGIGVGINYLGTLTNDGTITGTGTGVEAYSGSTVTNSGTISSVWGTGVVGVDSTVTNSGTISSVWGDGVLGTNSTVTNSGTIQSGENTGVVVYGSSTLTNSATGIIDGSWGGVYAEGDNTIVNNGIIRTANNNGIESWGGTVTNTGTIQSNDTGLYFWNSTVTNSGTIEGNLNDGVYMYGGTLTNTGTIRSNTNAGLVFLLGTATNSGIISGATYAIFGSTGVDSTLNILPGSQLFGAIDLGIGDMDIVNIYGGGTTSYTVDFVGAEQINVFGAGLPVFVNGTTVTVVGQSSGAQRQASNLGTTTSSVHNLASSRLNRNAPGGSNKRASRPLQVAALELAPGMLHVSEPSKAWTEVFTFKRNNEGSATALSSEHEGSGVVLGYDFDHSNTRIGVLAGFAASSSETDNVKSAKTDTTSMYLGAYGRFSLGFANLTASLIGGMENHENTRYVQYLLTTEKAKGDNTSYFISPSLGLGSAFTAGDGFELRPSVNVSYAMAEYDGYQEKGTTAQNLKVKGYGASSLTSSAQLAVASVGKGGEVELRAGVRARQTEADSVSANLAGVSFKYGAAEDEKISGGYGGVYVRYSLGDRTNFTVDAEMANLGHGDEKEFFGTLGLDISF